MMSTYLIDIINTNGVKNILGHGGKRPNQTGRPKVEPYKTISFRAPIIDIDKAKLKFGRKLNQLFREWLKKL